MISKSPDVDKYIESFKSDTKQRLILLREIVLEVCPQADEAISYGIIGYKLNNKPLVYIGGYEKPIGFYATPNGHEAFTNEFAQYKQGKGSVQLPLDKPLPTDLIKRVIEYRIEQAEL